MNSSGCAEQFVRDTIFPLGVDASTLPCTLLVPFYVCFLAFGSIVHLVVAYSRTTYILHRARTLRKGAMSSSGRLNVTQRITITQSWVTFLTTLSFIIVPLTYGTSNNIITFLLGILVFSFWVSSNQWFSKLLRLGGKIIDHNHGKGDSSSASNEKQNSNRSEGDLDFLSKQDWLITLIFGSVRIAMVVQLVLFCVLSLVFPDDRIPFQVAIGLQSYNVFASTCLFVYQYQRCKMAILSANERVQAILTSKKRPGQVQSTGTSSAVRKFVQHQLILIGFGTVGSLTLLLWSIEIIPINYGLLLFCVFCDIGSNGSLFLTFVARTSRKKRPQTAAAGSATLDNAGLTVSVADATAGTRHSARIKTVPPLAAIQAGDRGSSRSLAETPIS